jgi:hypothetical protein
MRGRLVVGFAGALALGLMAVVPGCGPGGPERVVVSGAVTYKGQPVPEGMIRFVPSDTADTPLSGAVITNGQYKADGHGGVAVGKYKVLIEGIRMDKTVWSKFPDVGARIQYIPEKYNTNSQLEFSVESGSRPITKNYELTE